MNKTVKREEINDKYKWDLAPLSKNWNTWNSDLEKLEADIKNLSEYQGKLNEFDSFKEYLLLKEESSILLSNLYAFANMYNHTDMRDNDSTASVRKIEAVYSNFLVATSWDDPEILSLGEDTINSYLEKDSKLSEYKFPMSNLFRMQKHVLDEDKEKLLSFFSNFSNTPDTIYNQLSTADAKNVDVDLSTGETVTVTDGNLTRLLTDIESQEDRKKVFQAHYAKFDNNKNTYAAIYNSILQRDIAMMNSRKYTNSLEVFLEGDNIPVSVYENLVETARTNSVPLKKYIKLRKERLGLDEYYTFDRFKSLVDYKKEYSYEDSLEIVKKSAEVIGREYSTSIAKTLSEGWVDVYENEGKRGGAYSWGAYGVHPYILLNHDNTLNDMFTIAHEAGHSLHTLYADRAQPYATHDYTIFVAEVASTFNEKVLLKHMLENTSDPKEKISLLQHTIDGLIGTFYRQILFADYEYQAHKLVEAGQPITSDTLSNIMITLYKEYYDLDITKEEVKEFVWARIPHLFNSPFYVYQYATSYAASAKIYADVDNGMDGALDRYFDLLKSGGSDYPINQLQKAGVDLTKPDAVMAVVKELDSLVDKLAEELNKLK